MVQAGWLRVRSESGIAGSVCPAVASLVHQLPLSVPTFARQRGLAECLSRTLSPTRSTGPRSPRREQAALRAHPVMPEPTGLSSSPPPTPDTPLDNGCAVDCPPGAMSQTVTTRHLAYMKHVRCSSGYKTPPPSTRTRRCGGMPEVARCESKTAAQIAAIAKSWPRPGRLRRAFVDKALAVKVLRRRDLTTWSRARLRKGRMGRAGARVRRVLLRGTSYCPGKGGRWRFHALTPIRLRGDPASRRLPAAYCTYSLTARPLRRGGRRRWDGGAAAAGGLVGAW